MGRKIHIICKYIYRLDAMKTAKGLTEELSDD